MARDNDRDVRKATDLTIDLILMTRYRGIDKQRFLAALGECWDAVEKAENEASVFH